MEKVYINGKMEEDMKDNTNMIKNMDLVVINGRMVENILVIGEIVKDMEKEK